MEESFKARIPSACMHPFLLEGLKFSVCMEYFISYDAECHLEKLLCELLMIPGVAKEEIPEELNQNKNKTTAIFSIVAVRELCMLLPCPLKVDSKMKTLVTEVTYIHVLSPPRMNLLQRTELGSCAYYVTRGPSAFCIRSRG